MEPLKQIFTNAKLARKSIAGLSDTGKSALIIQLANKIAAEAQHIIIENQRDLDKMSDTDPKKDRLLLNGARIEALCDSLGNIARLPDPTQVVLSENMLKNGLSLKKITVPLGVIGVIYESRPNVTIDVSALSLRSGNVCLLRGGQDAYHTNQALITIIQDTIKSAGLDEHIVQLLPTDRSHIKEILTAVDYIDVIIPRGSNQLIEYVRNNATVPVIETGAGVCHTYVEQSADTDMAVQVVANAKISRPSVCNALDTILIDAVIAEEFLEKLALDFAADKIEIFADVASYSILNKLNYPFLNQAEEADFGREFLDYKCSIKLVSGIEDALEHVSKYSSKHSEAILTSNEQLSDRFLQEVDAAVVYLNASTRFTDGEVFELGAEIGISTQKLHARGPFALEKLVTEKWIVKGNGQIR